MIEVVYRDGKEGIVLPKNVKQIGDTSDRKKLYLEDYVNTFFKKMIQDQKEEQALVVLLGKWQHLTDESYLFVDGAIGVLLREEEETGSKIKENKDRFFSHRDIVGCFLSGSENAAALSRQIEVYTEQLLDGETALCVIRETIEGEEQLFWREAQGDTPIKGYYIYYEKNSGMQEYLVTYNDGISTEAEEPIQDQAIRSFRKHLRNVKHHSISWRIQGRKATGAIMTVALLVTGISLVNSYNKLTKLEQAVGEIQTMVLEEAKAVDGAHMTVVNQKELLAESERMTEAASELQVAMTEKEIQADRNVQKTEVESETEEQSVQSFYTIKEGDTLAEICQKYYGNLEMLQTICDVNGIVDLDYVLPGEKIILP